MSSVAIKMIVSAEIKHGMKGRARDARDESLRMTLKWWHRYALPKHFTPEGAREYGYQLRSDAYQRRKAGRARRGGGSVRPLVYSGDLERAVKGARPEPEVRGKSGLLRFSGAPHYLTINQKVSLAQINEALGAFGGNKAAAAIALGVSLRTIERRLENRRDIHEDRRVSGWQVLTEEAGRIARESKSVDAITEWRAMHELVKAAFQKYGGVREAARALDVSMSTFAKYLRNPEYRSAGASGRTIDKVKELRTVSPGEAATMAKIAQTTYLKALKGSNK